MGNTPAIPEKNHHYASREHYADDYPVWTQDGFEIVKLNLDEILTKDQAQLKLVGDRILRGLSNDNIIIIQTNPDFHEKIVQAGKEAKVFLSLSQAQKNLKASEKVDDKRAFYSGYSLIHFENRDNRRDKEWRDVFQVRFGEDGHIPWPSTEFQSAATQLYTAQWNLCVQVVHALALSLGVNPLDFFDLVGSSSTDDTMPDLHKSENTNLSFFHYFDKYQSYQKAQKCMVHRDHGLLTVLPKSDLPGLELLHPILKQWIPMEQFIDENEVLLFCGEALGEVTNSRVVPATHRVVRQPKLERYSMPFEMKPNNEAVLKNLVNPESNAQPSTFDDLTKRLQWEKIMRQVDRADGLEPGATAEQLKEDAKVHNSSVEDVQPPSLEVR